MKKLEISVSSGSQGNWGNKQSGELLGDIYGSVLGVCGSYRVLAEWQFFRDKISSALLSGLRKVKNRELAVSELTEQNLRISDEEMQEATSELSLYVVRT